ncbi:MAG: hypothetical protein EHM24_13115 [Acidobacteria bacterium]|nr:MAG: hypothetical protein EHM24_13115 [Acidobacteriota bacterium]
MKSVKVSTAVLGIASWLLLTGVLEAATPTLKNTCITAHFGRRGLVAIDAAPAGQGGAWRAAGGPTRIPFPTEDFAVTLSGRAYESRTLPAPTVTASKDKVGFAWSAGPYQVTVVYELQPGWDFVSKQLSIASTTASTFRVEEVTVFKAALAVPIAGTFIPKSARPNLGTGDYGVCLRLDDQRGLLAVVQNPFLEVQMASTTPPGERSELQTFTIRYKPDLEWKVADGPFVADRGMLAPYALTGRLLPGRMLPEWTMGPNDAEPGMDEGEVEAFTGMVRAFLLAKPQRPVNVFVPWCLNDYQIDIATPEGRAEYKRILDSAASLGAEHVIVAPTNADLAKREDSLDDWSWENLLWIGFGQKLRANQWKVDGGPVPASVQEMLDYARSKRLKLLAYVYPVLPFAQDPSWLVSPANNPKRFYANLGFRHFQDWLIETLVAFHERFGLGGYSFDHTFLAYPGASRYAQWAGWRRVMAELRHRVPDIVIDGRQAYHLYGPWGWLAGSFPHPTFNDEQPESFVPFPDLHFDRVSADRERYTAYRYRNYEFAPSEIVPGFITHQTSRADDTGEMPERKTDRGIMLLPFRQRDWDYLGWRYSLLSSIAIAGWNNVLDYIPARDRPEYEAFSAADREFFRKWIDWTAANKDYLRRTRTIIGQPAMGRVDGTSAILGNRGYLFLFNPNGRRMDAEFVLDETIGLEAPGRFLLKELYPAEGRLIGKPRAGVWNAGDRVKISMDGGSAIALALEPAVSPAVPMLFNSPGTATIQDGVVTISGIRGEAGTETELLVMLPAGQSATSARVNGNPVTVVPHEDGVMSVRVAFAGAPFRQYQQVGGFDPGFTGGRWTGTVAIPQRVFDQLAARQKAWPLPWTSEDYKTTWLAPERLLLFVQIAEPDDCWEARMRIDGRTVELKKAYTAVRVARRTFVGFYADLSLLSADREHSIELDLPTLRPGQLQGVFFENIEPAYTGVVR